MIIGHGGYRMNNQQNRQERKHQRGKIPPPRLYGILARSTRVGVILRRGPSKQVQLIKWNLKSDELQHGQWFKGRIHEDWCDLSPSGDLFLYFAAPYRAPYGTWTAISKPPFLTALALWTQGDSWWGGGKFINDNKIYLSHPPDRSELAEGYTLKSGMRMGESSEVPEALWVCIQKGVLHHYSDGSCEYNPPRINEKVNYYGYKIQQICVWHYLKSKPYFSYDYRIFGLEGDIYLDLPATDWADWDQGDFVFAKNGCLYRLSCNKKGHFPPVKEQFFKLIHNFRTNSFTELKAPFQACKW